MRTVLRLSVLAIAALAVIALCADSAMAQRGGRGGQGGRGGGAFGFGGGFGGGGGGAIQLLQDDAVKKELDLVDEQVSKLQEIANKVQEDTRGLIDFGSLRDLSEDERNARLAEAREKGEKLTAEAQKQIDEVLLPNQSERLKQLVVQSSMRFGADRALTTGSLAEELKVTEEQKQKLAQKQEEVQAKLQEQIAELRQKAQQELFSVLDPEQQKKLQAMIGKPFTFSGGGGGFGGAGGGFGTGGGRGRGGRGGDGAGRPPRDGN